MARLFSDILWSEIIDCNYRQKFHSFFVHIADWNNFHKKYIDENNIS